MANLIRRRANEGLAAPATTWDPFRMMEEILGWDPFRELGWQGERRLAPTFAPTFEVLERKDAYVFKADLPGVKESDLDISLTENRLTLSGHREAEKKAEDETFYTYERSYGSFTRTFSLPEGVDGEHVHADLKDGVLTLVVPKKPEVQPKRIQIKPGQARSNA
jgi:HSP20 family protein